MYTTATAESRVQRGAALLDRVVPGWDREGVIDLETLDITSGSRCVLGQLFADRVEGSFHGYLTGYGWAISHEDSPLKGQAYDGCTHGFCCGSGVTEEWKNEIRRRRSVLAKKEAEPTYTLAAGDN